jgi:8-oxo-dGTP pyrophosphatase MutT (NUDIX family)
MKLQLYSQFLHAIWNLKQSILSYFGGKTVGARALVIKNDSEILLVHHTYTPGWASIGGAVDKGETCLEALTRELLEEAGVRISAPPTLFSLYYSDHFKRDDFVAFFIVKEFTISDSYSPEIAEKRWFKLSDLPPDVAPGTKRRIDEYLGLKPISDRW